MIRGSPHVKQAMQHGHHQQHSGEFVAVGVGSGAATTSMRVNRKTSPWRSLSEIPDGTTRHVIERLSNSQSSLRSLVEEARKRDPSAFERARDLVEREEENRFSSLPLDVLVCELESNVKLGLSTEDVTRIRERTGANILTRAKRTRWWKLFLRQFTSPVVIMLLVAAVVALGFQEWVEGAAILIVVFLNALLASSMERSAGNALARLASLAAPSCRVIRNGGQLENLNAVDLVPGDIVRLETGDSVPADLRCFDLTELTANEAILTGTSYTRFLYYSSLTFQEHFLETVVF